MKKIKSNNTSNALKPSIPNSNKNQPSRNDKYSNINEKDQIDAILGEKVKEFQNILKMKKEQNNQALSQLQNLREKSNELISKRNKMLVSLNQQKSNIYILKTKNKAYRNYLSELTSKESSNFENKKKDDIFNSIAKLSENISNNITNINEILKENGKEINLNENDFLKNIPVDFLKNISSKNIGNK